VRTGAEILYYIRIGRLSNPGFDVVDSKLSRAQVIDRILLPMRLGKPVSIDHQAIDPHDVRYIAVSCSTRPYEEMEQQASRERAARAGGRSVRWRIAAIADDCSDELWSEVVARVPKGLDLPLGSPATTDELAPRPTDRRSDHPPARRVFVVHGHDLDARSQMFTFLRAIGLEPIEWEQAVQETGSASPLVLDVVRAGFALARAAVILFTGDDRVQSLRSAAAGANDFELQPRPNVLIEAGMALATHRDRTVFVQFGSLREASDLAGLAALRMDGWPSAKRNALVERLRVAGCAVTTSGADWLDLKLAP
jgi:predicted nucleotide-binding protein